MKRSRRRWSELLTSLGEAGWELARAEVRVVSTEMRLAGRKLGGALLLLLVALFALFWAIGALAMVVVEVVSLWLPRWGGALVVLALFLLVGLVLALVARRRLRSIEPPADTVKRRIEEHRDWWDRKIASASRPASRRFRGSGPSEPDPDETETP